MSNISGPINGGSAGSSVGTSASVTALVSAQLAPYITSASASTMISTRLGPYITSASAVTLVANFITSASASTMVASQLVPYVTSASASTMISGQLGPYITSASASTQYATIPLTINTKTSSYTLVLGDGVNTYIRMNVGSANNLTVPPNSSVAFPIGTQIPIRQTGAGQTTIVQGSGVVISTAETLLLRKQGSTASLIKTGTNAWDLAGDLQAS